MVLIIIIIGMLIVWGWEKLKIFDAKCKNGEASETSQWLFYAVIIVVFVILLIYTFSK